MRTIPDVARATPTSARRRRERRIRSFFRHEQMAVHVAVVSAQHHSAQRCCSIATQTDDFVPAAIYAATASPAATYVATAVSPWSNTWIQHPLSLMLHRLQFSNTWRPHL